MYAGVVEDALDAADVAKTSVRVTAVAFEAEVNAECGAVECSTVTTFVVVDVVVRVDRPGAVTVAVSVAYDKRAFE